VRRARPGELRRALAVALRLLCLLAFVLAGIGPAAHAQVPTGGKVHGGTMPCTGAGTGHDKASPGSGCCVAGPCKMALPWPVPPAPPVAGLQMPQAASLPAMVEATPQAPWRPPA
jgi:hypothetical protein